MKEQGWRSSSIDQAAGLLWSAWQSGALIDELPAECRPLTPQHGNSVQSRLEGLIGGRFGWKIAATSAAGQRHIGAQRPLHGRLFSRFVVDNGGRLSIARSKMHMCVAEAEFAFRIGAAGSSTGLSAAGLADEMHLAIELPDSRFAHFEKVGVPQLIADDACGGHFVLGPAVPGWREVDLEEQAVAVHVNGQEVTTGHGKNVLSGPLNALEWLAAELASCGEQLRPGDIVTTGVAAVPVPVSAGDTVVASFPRLGTVEVSIDA